MLSNSRGPERTELEERLALSEAHVTGALMHLTRQRELAKALESRGPIQLAAMARNLLRLFEEVTAIHIADRDRLARLLAEFGSPPR